MSAGKAGRGGGRRRAAEGRCLVAQQGGAAGRESRGSALCEGRWGSAPPLRTSEESPGPASGHLGTRGRDGALSRMPVVAGGGACARARGGGQLVSHLGSREAVSRGAQVDSNSNSGVSVMCDFGRAI